MRIGLVSTYPPTHCGIATYTKKLGTAMAGLHEVTGLTVLADLGPDRPSGGTPQVISTFPRGGQFAPAILEQATSLGLNVVHFQHAADLFGMDGRLLDLCRQLRHRNIATVVTLHTVYSRLSGLLERKPGAVRFHRELARCASALIVHHEKTCRQTLLAQGVPAGVLHVIPHGTDDSTPGDSGQARGLLGLSTEIPIALSFGFIHVQKNLHVLLKAWPGVRQRHPGALLILAGRIQNPTWYNRAYSAYLHHLVRSNGLADNVLFMERFIPEEEIPLLFAASDLILFPYAQGYGSASGALHLAMAAGRPVVCSRIPKFEEVEELAFHLTVPPHKPRLWSKAIGDLFDSSDSLFTARGLLAARAKATGWNTVAMQHLDVYRSLLPLP
jgi:glycosyltransferase involved in cell wall biosynthesis